MPALPPPSSWRRSGIRTLSESTPRSSVRRRRPAAKSPTIRWVAGNVPRDDSADRRAEDVLMATLYVGGRLFDGDKVLDGHAVLEDGGKVKKVAPAGEFTGFAGDKVDTSGGTLIPGIIDCHIHSLSG